MNLNRRGFLKGTGALIFIPSLVSVRMAPPIVADGGYLVTIEMDKHIISEITNISTFRSFTFRDVEFLCEYVGVEDIMMETNGTRPGWIRIRVDHQKVDQVRRVLESYKPITCELEVVSF